MAVSACAQVEAPVAASTPARVPTGLAGSSWRLTAIVSMDDAQGTTRPAEDQVYRVSFGADGRAGFILHCNRGSGGWTAEPGADRRNGALTFGAIAMTRALCPAPSLDVRIARDLAYVRSFVLNGDKLSFSLMADGGIYEWVRDEAP